MGETLTPQQLRNNSYHLAIRSSLLAIQSTLLLQKTMLQSQHATFTDIKATIASQNSTLQNTTKALVELFSKISFFQPPPAPPTPLMIAAVGSTTLAPTSPKSSTPPTSSATATAVSPHLISPQTRFVNPQNQQTQQQSKLLLTSSASKSTLPFNSCPLPSQLKAIPPGSSPPTALAPPSRLSTAATNSTSPPNSDSSILPAQNQQQQFVPANPQTIFQPNFTATATTHKIIPTTATLVLPSQPINYYGANKQRQLICRSTLSSSFFHSTGTGLANDTTRFINISSHKKGHITLAVENDIFPPLSVLSPPVAEHEKNSSTATPSLSDLLLNSSLASKLSTTNITALLEKSGCQTFTTLVQTSGVLKISKTAEDKGLTLFVPNNEVFKAKWNKNLSILSDLELVTLLQHLTIPSYIPKDCASIDSDIETLPCLEYSGPWAENELGCKSLIVEMNGLMCSSFYYSQQPIISPTVEKPIKYIFPSLQKLIQDGQILVLQSNHPTPFAMTVDIRNKLRHESKILIFDPGGTLEIVDLEDKVIFEGMVMIRYNDTCHSPSLYQPVQKSQGTEHVSTKYKVPLPILA